MKNTAYFRNKKVLIVGLARSGLACANLLHSLGARICLTDNKDDSSVRANLSNLSSREIKVELGRHSREFVKQSELVIVSPGVTPDAQPPIWARECGIPVVSEIEAASILCPATIIAVTGSNGKTTATTLIGKMLESSGRRVFVCGNIGNPFSGEVAKMNPSDFVVLEVSSFQLETIRDFKPRIAVILNISQNHLDRYSGMQEYVQAKKRIFKNQDDADYLLLNAEDPLLKDFAACARSRVVFFSASAHLNPNQSAVLSVGRILGIEERTAMDVFRGFKGLEHRMEEVAVIKGVKFINDSKATTADSAAWALKNINNPVVLIAGGRDKGIDYRLILGPARSKVKEVILIGEAREKIGRALRGHLPVEGADDLKQAVTKAFSRAEAGDTVLFSPMCSSFDMFRDYEERGRVFKSIVAGLKAAGREKVKTP